MSAQRAAFLDRDGTIIEDVCYINDPKRVSLIPGSAEALRLLKANQYLIFVISNQSGLGRGYISKDQFLQVQEEFSRQLKEEGIEVDGYLYCFHHPDEACECRKPKTGLIPSVHKNHPIALAESFSAGDRDTDVFLGKNFGGTGYLLLTGQGKGSERPLLDEGRIREEQIFPDLLSLAKNLTQA